MLLTIMQHFKMVGLYQRGPLLHYYLDYLDKEVKLLSPQLYAHFVKPFLTFTITNNIHSKVKM